MADSISVQANLTKIAQTPGSYLDGGLFIPGVKLPPHYRFSQYSYVWATDEAGRMLKELGYHPKPSYVRGKPVYYWAGIKDALNKFKRAHGISTPDKLESQTAALLIQKYNEAKSASRHFITIAADHAWSDQLLKDMSVKEFMVSPAGGSFDPKNRKWVALLQWRLSRHHKSAIAIDGIMGNETRGALTQAGLAISNPKIKDFILGTYSPSGTVTQPAAPTPAAAVVPSWKESPDTFVKAVRDNSSKKHVVYAMWKWFEATDTGRNSVTLSDKRWVALLQWRLGSPITGVADNATRGRQLAPSSTKVSAAKSFQLRQFIQDGHLDSPMIIVEAPGTAPSQAQRGIEFDLLKSKIDLHNEKWLMWNRYQKKAELENDMTQFNSKYPEHPYDGPQPR